MNVHLIVPELFWPHEDTAARPAGELELPGLETLLARGRRARGKAPHLEGWLCEQFGIARQQDWPIAPFALLADGGKPGDHYWLRADPAHLDVATDQLVLDASAISVTPQEAEALVAALNHHFDADAMTFHAVQPDRWYVRLTHAPELATTPIAAARGRAIDPLLPSGPEAKQWHARLNEMQMVLHEHPINEAREARGEAAINSLWFWGGGHFLAPVRRPFAR
jgi:hypothetical protein